MNTMTNVKIDSKRELVINPTKEEQGNQKQYDDKYQEKLLRRVWLALIRDTYPTPIVSEMEIFFKSRTIVEIIDAGVAASEKLLGRVCTIISPFLRLVDLTDRTIPTAFRKTLLVCRFGKRYTPNTLDKNLTSFWENNDRVLRWHEGRHTTLLIRLREVVTDMLSQYDYWKASVEGEIHLSTGADFEGSHSRIDKLYAVEQYFPHLLGLSLGTPWFNITTNQEPHHNKMMCVPKNYKKVRHIAMEPQWMSVKAYPVAYAIEKCLPSFADIHDQERNRLLAYRGSKDGSLATIDLSAASDSIGIRLCQEVLPYPVFKDIYQVTSRYTYQRVNRCKSKGEGRSKSSNLKRYYGMISTMGNRVTFPLETLLFSGIVTLAKELYECYTGDVVLTSDIGVYGDDIIVPHVLVETVTQLLELFGFIVNTEKSFTDPNFLFRESCGVEYYSGHAVDTDYWPRKALNPDNALVHLIPLQHKLYRLPYTNDVLTREILRLCPKMTMSYPDSPYDDLWSDYPTIRYCYSSYAKDGRDSIPESAAKDCEVHTMFEPVRGSTAWSEGIDRLNYYQFQEYGIKYHTDPILSAIGYPAEKDRTRGTVHPDVRPKNRKFLI